MDLRSFFLLGSVEARALTALGCRLERAAIEDRRYRLGIPLIQKSSYGPQV
jgi:hypothetical protein